MANSIFIWPGNITFSGATTFTGAVTMSSDLSVAGIATFALGAVGTPSLTFTGNTNTGMWSRSSNVTAFSAAGSEVAEFNTLGLKLSGTSISWATTFGGANDLVLSRGGAGMLSLTGTTPMLLLGGTTSSFPAWKRNAAIMQARLADDSADANVSANAFQTTTALIATGGGAGLPAFVANSTGGTNQPATANQNGWIRMQDSTGATIWVPVWK